MKKYIIILLFAISCMSKTKQDLKVVYDEAALNEFVLATAGSDNATTLREMDSVLTQAAKDSAVFAKTIAFLEQPFGNPNSAYRNEEIYAAVLTAKMKSEWTDSATKTATREKLYLLMQNRPGSMANDFTYTTAAGYKKKMYDVKADYVLLYFNSPGCDACKQMKEALAASPVIKQKIKTGALIVLSIYPDRDEKLWLDHLNEYPESWIQGRDENEYLYKHKIYDLRAIPTIYLLDWEKKVLLKDCVDVGMIEKEISKHQQ